MKKIREDLNGTNKVTHDLQELTKAYAEIIHRREWSKWLKAIKYDTWNINRDQYLNGSLYRVKPDNPLHKC